VSLLVAGNPVIRVFDAVGIRVGNLAGLHVFAQPITRPTPTRIAGAANITVGGIATGAKAAAVTAARATVTRALAVQAAAMPAAAMVVVAKAAAVPAGMVAPTIAGSDLTAVIGRSPKEIIKIEHANPSQPAPSQAESKPPRLNPLAGDARCEARFAGARRYFLIVTGVTRRRHSIQGRCGSRLRHFGGIFFILEFGGADCRYRTILCLSHHEPGHVLHLFDVAGSGAGRSKP
jgi:hypothetical protein